MFADFVFPVFDVVVIFNSVRKLLKIIPDANRGGNDNLMIGMPNITAWPNKAPYGVPIRTTEPI